MRVVALAGGVGGAKLAHGLAQCLPASDVTVIVNTADDFVHLGLNLSPDVDTVCYTLAGLANEETGWGRTGESWNALVELERLGGPTWFRLGDRDLATHLERTRLLSEGRSLSEVVRVFCDAWHIEQTVLPMSDEPVRTIVRTDQGDMTFQEYFVHQRCEPQVRGFRFDGAQAAQPAPGVVAQLKAADLAIICPSNPWVSIGPMLAIPGLRAALTASRTLAVSPIIGGKAVKGPADKMYRELGFQPSAAVVARHYQGIADTFVIDSVDKESAEEVRGLGMRVLVTNILMPSVAERRRLAADVLDFVQASLR